MCEFITPDWPAPDSVRAVSTTRRGGRSRSPYDGLNLATHVGDSDSDVAYNRKQLSGALALPARPNWLQQVHGIDITIGACAAQPAEADGAFSSSPGEVLAVMTADCLPLLMCNRQGTEVAAVHAGWRGLLNGVIESAVARFTVPADELLIWFGPAIGAASFEVGDEVRTQFLEVDEASAIAFQTTPNGRWLADIYQLAQIRLQKQGIAAIYGGEYCTVSDVERFYSYRRDGVTGRMASLIWMTPE